MRTLLAFGWLALAPTTTAAQSARLEALGGRVELVRPGERSELVAERQTRSVDEGTAIELGARARAAIGWSSAGSARIEGPARLTRVDGLEPLGFEHARTFELEVRRGERVVELAAGVRATFAVGVYRLRSLPEGLVQLETLVGGPARVVHTSSSGASWEIDRVSGGESVRVASTPRALDTRAARARAAAWNDFTWPWGATSRASEFDAAVRALAQREANQDIEELVDEDSQPSTGDVATASAVTANRRAEPQAEEHSATSQDASARYVEHRREAEIRNDDARRGEEHDHVALADDVVQRADITQRHDLARRADVTQPHDVARRIAGVDANVASDASVVTTDQNARVTRDELEHSTSSSSARSDALTNTAVRSGERVDETSGDSQGHAAPSAAATASPNIRESDVAPARVERRPAGALSGLQLQAPAARPSDAARATPTPFRADLWHGVERRSLRAIGGAVIQDDAGLVVQELEEERVRLSLPAAAAAPAWVFGASSDYHVLPGGTVVLDARGKLEAYVGKLRAQPAPAGRPATP